MRVRSQVKFLLILLLLPFVLSRARAAEDCSNISQVVDFKQLYAPATIELRYVFTRSFEGEGVPYGFATGFTFSKNPTFMRFEVSENDTFKMWMMIQYDSFVEQYLNLTFKEGSRPAEQVPYHMCGQAAYFAWTTIQVVPEPRTQYTLDEYWSFGQPRLENMFGAIGETAGTILQNQFGQYVIDVVLILALGFVMLQNRKLARRLKGLA